IAMINEEIKNNNSSDVDYTQTTPLFKQFLEVKRSCPDVVLLYRVGDFYEVFFEDAIILSKELGLTLTGKDGGNIGRVPMAGIPVKSLNLYIPKLLDKNYKVSICEQLENPAQSGKLFTRKIVKTITAGTITELNLLEPSGNNFLAAIINVNNVFGFAYTDITTGEFKVTKGSLDEILSELARIKPSEVLAPVKKQKILPFQIVPDEKIDLPEEITNFYPCTKVSSSSFSEEKAVFNLKKFFNIVSLDSFGFEEYKPALYSAGAIIEYIIETQKGIIPEFDVIKPYSISDFVSISASTRRNLELIETAKDKTKYGSLYWAIDRVKSPMGARLLKSWITQPIINIDEIQKRQNAVEELINNTTGRLHLADMLSRICDMERLAVKLSNENLNPREFLALKDTLSIIPDFQALFNTFQNDYLKDFIINTDNLTEFASTIDRTIDENAPSSIKEGGFIKDNINGELDYFRDILNGGEQWLKDFELKQKELTGIKNLRVGYNRNFGFFIEVTNSNLSQIPLNYTRKQTLTNAERFITEELKKHETDVFSAKFKTVEIEQKIFKDLSEYAKNFAADIKEISHFISRADVLSSFAQTAIESNYVKPEISNSNELYIKDGRHPVVEKILPMGQYVPNDLKLTADINNFEDTQFMILTGPNMAGKSTYMRQNALIVLLAQIGSFVPASYARVGIVDKIFTRAGAVDDLSLGQSTFMVEMSETAYILNSATEKSLILLDEIGRGTSTYDGVAIAWAVAEYIAAKIKARTIFATHYHELNVMPKSIDRIKNYRITLSEESGEIQFLRKVVEGSASKSYGIQVAKMAGLPNCVISKAQNLMNRMQKDYSKDLSGKKSGQNISDVPQLSLFLK
ncbi:MAG: DNA mismatch repair protein MutS, partial [Candidatus Gastranaerophilales bacterium]|nr:DNA mismatch repair protein MutS [Candidatus Gastranaerophilales bacterium]